ncbi:hypothetical protein HYPDE_23453 [Hyphomicrobium denitrificans 1NES1]|uniref:Uncharacterized protein n=1 Tax=Hyphomicrobium denitrificans 1NES1 TaxID=670307 RepID=N0B2G4_9HYPH|nr:hypothetical protein HYPDE_23453 [Hyphomicrobium denitrificans 1NES1]
MRKIGQKITSQLPVVFVLAGLLGIFRAILGKGHNAFDYAGCIALVGILCALMIFLANGIDFVKQKIIRMYRTKRTVQK